MHVVPKMPLTLWVVACCVACQLHRAAGFVDLNALHTFHGATPVLADTAEQNQVFFAHHTRRLDTGAEGRGQSSNGGPTLHEHIPKISVVVRAYGRDWTLDLELNDGLLPGGAFSTSLLCVVYLPCGLLYGRRHLHLILRPPPAPSP